MGLWGCKPEDALLPPGKILAKITKCTAIRPVIAPPHTRTGGTLCYRRGLIRRLADPNLLSHRADAQRRARNAGLDGSVPFDTASLSPETFGPAHPPNHPSQDPPGGQNTVNMAPRPVDTKLNISTDGWTAGVEHAI